MTYNNYLRFMPGVESETPFNENDLLFAFSNGELLVSSSDNTIKIPHCFEILQLGIKLGEIIYIGTFDGIRCYCSEAEEKLSYLEDFAFKGLRAIINLIDEDLFMLCGRAAQIIDWSKNHRFCGRCGCRTENKKGERAKVCTACGLLNYPRISPAIIVAVTKGDSLLLAHNKQFNSNRYSVVAGFVEPGETFEQCVMREVMEEIGIKVKNIKYFGSQPWPFPNSMMVAFTAEFESGEITVDNVEIDDANWFKVNEIPMVPGSGSVASKLIKWFIDNF